MGLLRGRDRRVLPPRSRLVDRGHLRTELVVDALDMGWWRRHPAQGQTVVHSDRLNPPNTRPGCSATDYARPG